MDISRLIVGIIAVCLTAAIAFWHKILDWTHESLFPWIKKNIPQLEGYARAAFSWFDQNIAVPARKLIKEGWKKFCEYVLKTVINFERSYGATRWTRKIKSFLMTPAKELKKIETIEQDISWEELPNDVREAFLRRGSNVNDFNFTEAREKEINQY